MALSLLMRKKTHRILQDLLDGVEESQNVLPSLHGVETGQQAQCLDHPPQGGLRRGKNIVAVLLKRNYNFHYYKIYT